MLSDITVYEADKFFGVYNACRYHWYVRLICETMTDYFGIHIACRWYHWCVILTDSLGIHNICGYYLYLKLTGFPGTHDARRYHWCVSMTNFLGIHKISISLICESDMGMARFSKDSINSWTDRIRSFRQDLNNVEWDIIHKIIITSTSVYNYFHWGEWMHL